MQYEEQKESQGMTSTVERLILQFLSDTSFVSLTLQDVARREHILPVVLDMGGCCAIRPNGEVVSFACDSEKYIRIETCPLIRNFAFCQGSKKYLELQEFIPTRPPEALECPNCKGKGELPKPFDKVVCYCGGVGWLPPGVPISFG